MAAHIDDSIRMCMQREREREKYENSFLPSSFSITAMIEKKKKKFPFQIESQ